jgi:hypothetical protein
LISFLAAVTGVLTFKYLRSSYATCSEDSFFPYLNYFFAPKFRAVFTIFIFFVGLSFLIWNIPIIISGIIWTAIAPVYVLCHPSLWELKIFIDIFLIDLLIVPLVLVPLVLNVATFKIGTSNEKKIKKIIFIMLVFGGCFIAQVLIRSTPLTLIEAAVERYASKGEKVWPVLLNRETKPREKEFRAKYLYKNNRVSEGDILLHESIAGYLDLLRFGVRGNYIRIILESEARMATQNPPPVAT